MDGWSMDGGWIEWIEWMTGWCMRAEWTERMDGCMDGGWMDGWIGGWMGGWMDE